MRQHRFIHVTVMTSLPSIVLSPQDIKKSYPRTVFVASPACVFIHMWRTVRTQVLWAYAISRSSEEQLPCLITLCSIASILIKSSFKGCSIFQVGSL